VDGVDITSFKKANIENSSAVFFVTNFKVAGLSDAHTLEFNS